MRIRNYLYVNVINYIYIINCLHTLLFMCINFYLITCTEIRYSYTRKDVSIDILHALYLRVAQKAFIAFSGIDAI